MSGSGSVARVMRLFELTAIFALATFFVVTSVPAIGALGQAGGAFGMRLGIRPDEAGHAALTVINVKPGSPAARAGVARGDHLAPNASLFDRIAATATVRPGMSHTFAFVRAGAPRPVTLVAAAGAVSLANDAFGRIFLAVRLASVIALAIVAVLLVTRAPSAMTWGLALFLLSLFPEVLGLEVVAPVVGPLLAQVIGAVYGGLDVLGHVGVIVFALRFPRNEVRGAAKIVDACVWPVAAALVLFRWIASRIGNLYWNDAALHLVVIVVARIVTLLPFVAAAMLVLTLMRSTGVERRRLQWVIAGVLVGCIAWPLQAIIGITLASAGAYFFRSVAMLTIFVPILVAYGVLRHRVLDVGFVVNRATIYTAVAATLVGVLGLVKLLAGAYLKGSFANTLQVLTAIGLGLSTQRLYKFADWLVDRYIFPNTHATEVRLKRLGDGLKYAKSTDIVASALTAEPADALNLGSAALFRRLEDGSILRRTAVGWNDCDVGAIDAHDPLTLYFEGDNAHLDLRALLANRSGFPPGTAAPQHGFPLMVARELAGCVLYSDHRDGTALDPDEIGMLDKLVKAAGDAYDPLLRVRAALRDAGVPVPAQPPPQPVSPVDAGTASGRSPT